MGYIQHHAIIVSSWDDKKLANARKAAKQIFQPYQVSSIVKSVVNTSNSFFIGPDGSKLGWEQDAEGDSNREHFIKYLDENAHTDGSNCLRYVEVMYADEEGKSEVVNHN